MSAANPRLNVTYTPAAGHPAVPLSAEVEPGMVQRVVEWASAKENRWKVILLAASPVVIGGLGRLGYLYYSKPPAKKTQPVTTQEDAPVKAKKKVTMEQEDKYVATTRRNEAIKEEEATQESTQALSPLKADSSSAPSPVEDDRTTLDNFDGESTTVGTPSADATSMSEEKRDELAQAAKSRGNKYYASKKYRKAVELYSKAIGYYPQGSPKCAVFFSNRAACYANMNEYEKVVEDCSSALEIDSKYVKAILRRGNAYEKMDKLTEALQDFTVACILEEFKQQTSMESADRVLRTLAKQRAAEMFAPGNTRKLELPSLSFISAYLSSYQYEYLTEQALKSHPTQPGDKLFVKAANAFAKGNWDLAYEQVRKAVEAGPEAFLPQALNMLGTFLFLIGNMEEAKDAVQKSLDLKPDYVNSYIKMASILMETDQEQETFQETLKLFDQAATYEPENADIYYHRGQIYFLMQEYQKALQEYSKSVATNPDFIFAQIQSAVAYYRLGDAAQSTRLFEEMISKYPQNADIHYYYGEILLDQRDVEGAIREFDVASKVNPSLALPILNRGIIAFHVQNDPAAAMEFTTKAIEADGRCELAYLHLAQMYSQQAKLMEAVLTYKRAVDLSRSASDAENAFMGMEAVRAQMAALQRLGAPNVPQMEAE